MSERQLVPKRYLPVDGCASGVCGFPPLKVADTEKTPGNELESILVTI